MQPNVTTGRLFGVRGSVAGKSSAKKTAPKKNLLLSFQNVERIAHRGCSQGLLSFLYIPQRRTKHQGT